MVEPSKQVAEASNETENSVAESYKEKSNEKPLEDTR